MTKASNLSDGTWYQTLTRAWEDESFRQALLDDAQATIEAQAAALPKYAKEIPADSRIPCIC